MSYILFTTEYLIDTELYQKLEANSFVVPYDSKNEDINIYAYYPKELYETKLKDGTLKSLKETLAIHTYGMEVPSDQVEKHIKKIEKVNKIEVGDIIYTYLYNELPLQVLSIDETNKTCKALLQLRGFKTLLELPLTEVYSPSEKQDKLLNFINIVKNKHNLFIDCDIFELPTGLESSYSIIFTILLRLKLRVTNLNLIFINPDENTTKIIEDFGLTAMYGSLSTVLLKYSTKEDYLFTNTFDFSHFVKGTFISLNDNVELYYRKDIEQYLGLPSLEYNVLLNTVKYILDRTLFKPDMSEDFLKNLIINDTEKVMAKYQNKKGFTYKMEHLMGKNNSESEVINYNKPTTLDVIIDRFKQCGMNYYLSNIENYFKILQN